MVQTPVRVRFAPSPTGPLHIGGVRTALYNYLFARQHGGKMIFRIEDTDSTRFVPGAEEYIIESFKWLGIKFDEGVGIGGDFGPYRQSERRDIYKKYVDQLLQNGSAYLAFDTPDELNAKRAEVPNFQYDASTRMEMRNSLTLSKDEVQDLVSSGAQYVVRFKIEPDREVHVRDLIRGDVVVNSSVLDDKVLYKSADQLPTYHLANIVDDHLMQVSHVIRGEEWLPSAPLHVLLYEAFGWQDTMPAFAHLPLLLKPDGKGKLSKRDGDKLGFPVFPLEWHDPQSGAISSGYRESGYLPEAVINFLALLGWNPGSDQELFTMQQLVELFDLSRCSKSGARFDFMKGWWFNREYLLQKTDEQLAPDFVELLKANGVTAEPSRAAQVIGMMKQKVVEYTDGQSGQTKKRNISFISDLWPLCDFFFIAPQEFDTEDKFIRKNWKETTATEMTQLAEQLEKVENFSIEGMKAIVDPWVEQTGLRPWNAWRICLVGKGQGPDMYELAAFLGKEETLSRMHHAIDILK
ncbi:MAG: glutamate--tRNA ligase [Bacteroidaceae bacterium]|nr:glutamate--tRNA ligase [Bacteroidaceae bacterium]MBR3734068.1 glutamate--tRNA ligase [Bacteroidaceae bacterium]MBR4650103.1 glutamate--tRNA ligase [Bacteroidaceae bacterium]